MIRRKTETRGRYDVGVYEVDIDVDMRRDALQFAKDIILSDNQYSRLLPENIKNSNDVSTQQKIEIQRTYMGKLGEIVFLKLLNSKGKIVNTQGMFEIYEGQDNVDSFDFETIDGESVDVKSGFRTIHTRLLVNIQQFDRMDELVKNGGMEILVSVGSKKAVQMFNKQQAHAYEMYEDAVAYKKYAVKRRDTKNIAATLKEARPMLEVEQRNLDADEFMLNTPTLTYDLRQGIKFPMEHRPEHFITKQTTVDPSSDGADIWKAALDTFFLKDIDLIDYVQRMVGLSAIGKVYVEALIIAYGEGRNGKSTFWNVIARVLGTYSGNISADIYLINRENVDWLINKSGFPFDFDMVVIDELSSFKSASAKRFKSLLKVRPKVKRIVGLTGTPSSNGLMDLWAEFRILDMGERLGRYITHYRMNFFVPDKRNQQMIFSYKPRPGAEDAIYRLISDITISMKSADFLKMSECIMNEVEVKLSEKEWSVYNTLRQEMVVSLEDEEIDAANAAALSGKLLQMANGAIYNEEKEVFHIHDRKLDALEDLIEGANGKPVLVAYWYNHDLERIKERFKVREIKTSKDIRDWNNGEISIAVIHPASAGHGLNLQSGGSTLIWFGLTWSLELYQQTNARLYRQGQNDTVVIHHIIAKDTIDEDVMRVLKLKEKTQTDLIDAVKARIGGGVDARQ